MVVEPIVTATMAELYIKQGHVDAGIEMYHQLVNKEPYNGIYRQRLNELEGNDQSVSKGDSMSFRDHLDQITQNIEGCFSCSIMGTDGIPIDTVNTPATQAGVDLQNVLVEYAGQMGQLQKSSDNLGGGSLSELAVITEKIAIIMRPITDEYFLGLTMNPNGNIGKGRYYLRVTAPKLVQELS